MSEKDWLDAKSYREPKWPIGGYAPGGYMGKCRKCEGSFFNMDKRAPYCFPCALEAMQASHEELHLRLRTVEQEKATLLAAINITVDATAHSEKGEG